MPTRRSHALASSALGLALLAGCGSGSDGTPSGGESSMSMSSSHSPSGTLDAAPTITIHHFAFRGAASVSPGSTVMVTNGDSETHSVTSDAEGGFDVTVPPGASEAFVAPSAPGSYAYHCVFHSDMRGTLRVR